jgi:ribosomal protein L15E
MGRPKRSAAQLEDARRPGIDPNKVYRWQEVPALVRVGRPCVTDALKDGSLESKIIGRARVVRGAWILAWLERAPAVPAGGGT